MSCEWTPFRKEGTPTAIDVSDKRPVSRQRIGQSPIYKHGIIKTDHQSINTWFAKAHAINEIKKKEHRALYTGKIEMRRTITSWNRPGMIFLPTIRNDIVDNFLMDNIARAEQRMMREGEKLQAQFLRQQQDKQRQERLDAQQQLAQEALSAPQQRTRVHEEPPPPKTIGLGSTVAPHKARRKSLWEAGSQEIDKRIITRGVKMSGAWFVLTVSRVSVDAREVGLRFTAEHVNATVPTTPPLSPASPTPSPPCVSTTTTMRMSWSALTTALYDMGRESLAERCLHCVTFPSPDFEIQARAFACAAFMMRRVYVEPDPNQGGWAIVLQQPEERIEQEEGRVEQDAVFLTATTSSTHGGSSDEEAEAPLNGGGSMLLPPQEQFGGKPYFPNSLSSLPPRAGALRTALFPDRANWHTTQSRLEMKQQDPLVYEASRPKLRQILPLPASLTSPMRKKKKKRKRHKRPKKESWVTPYGSVAYGNGNIAFAKQKSKRKFKRKQLPALAVPVVAMTIEEELNKEMRNEQRLEARRAFLNQAKDPNISDAHRTTLLNGAATIDRLRELDGYSLTGLHALPDFKFHGAVHGALHKQHHADEDDQFYFKPRTMQQEELHRDDNDDDDDDGSRYTEQEHSEAAVEINALCTEVAQELLSEQPAVGAQRRSMPMALMQRRLEATDALEAVARFNSKHKCIPLTPVVGKTRSAAPLVAHQGLYMPSDSDDEEEERKEEEDRKAEAERKRKERQHKKKAKREKRQHERKQREEKQAIEVIEAEKKRKQQQQQQKQQQPPPPPPPPPPQDKRKRSKTKKATKSNRPVSPLLPQSPPTPQKKKKRPISSPDKHSQTIECVFPAGPLGLSLGDCSTGPSSPATNDGRSSPPPSPARTMTVIIDVEDHCLHGQILKMGDVIERIDQVSCNCLRFQQVLKLIRTAPRPMTVAFRRETIVQQPATSLKASPRSQTFVKQPGLISSPPMPDKYARASVPVQDMFLMEDDGSDER